MYLVKLRAFDLYNCFGCTLLVGRDLSGLLTLSPQRATSISLQDISRLIISKQGFDIQTALWKHFSRFFWNNRI
jgi:hypothetical protein